MGGHQSSFDPPPEGSAKCSLDLRALLNSLAMQRLHPITPPPVPQGCVYLYPAHSRHFERGEKKKKEQSLIAADVNAAHRIDGIFCIPATYSSYLVGTAQLKLSDNVG